MYKRYEETLRAFDSIIPPYLKGIIVTKYDDYNGCIEVEPFGFKAVVEEGIIYNYPTYISQQRRQIKCPGANETLVNRFSGDDTWVDDCATIFTIQKRNCVGKILHITLEEAFGSDYHVRGCHEYFSYVLQKDILRVYSNKETQSIYSFYTHSSPTFHSKLTKTQREAINMHFCKRERATHRDISHVFEF